jgi:hypothetical protein
VPVPDTGDTPGARRGFHGAAQGRAPKRVPKKSPGCQRGGAGVSATIQAAQNAMDAKRAPLGQSNGCDRSSFGEW